MIVSCPSCSTRFTVDPAVLGTHGRRVRCVRCGHVWHQTPEAASLDARSEPDSASEQLGSGPGQPAPVPPPDWTTAEPGPEPARRQVGGWLLFAAVVLLLAVGIVAGQERIVGAWPAAARLYDTIGMADPVPGHALRIVDVRPEARLEDGQRSIVVTGRVLNPTASTADLPLVRAALLDDSGNVLSELSTALGLPRLEGGEEAGFAVEFTDPPDGADRIAVSFEDPTEGR